MKNKWPVSSQDDILNRASGMELYKSEQKVYSQNGEDGILFEIINRLGITKNGYAVEIGVGDGIENCSRFLVEALGWHTLYIEAEKEYCENINNMFGHNKKVSVLNEYASLKNINDLIRSGVSKSPNIIFIDIDSIDYQIFDVISFKPKLFVVEYNGQLPLNDSLVANNSHWDGTANYGASLGALQKVASKKGYSLIHTDLCGVNAFFIRNDLLDVFPEHKSPKKRKANHFLSGGGLHKNLDMSTFVEY